MVVKMDIAVNHLVGFQDGSRFMAVNALRFEDGEEIFRHGVLSYGVPFLDMEGVMPYACEVY
mgnify:CR=1 FL=1